MYIIMNVKSMAHTRVNVYGPATDTWTTGDERF
jgi:hypothetical protein